MKKTESNSIVVSILDIDKYNQFLADKIRTNYWEVHPILKKEFRIFAAEVLGIAVGPSLVFAITSGSRRK